MDLKFEANLGYSKTLSQKKKQMGWWCGSGATMAA
jgi:hypothetical protein